MSILKVDTINEKTTGNGVAIPNLTMPSGTIVRMGHAKHSTYHAASNASTWVEAYQFSISGITADNTIYMMYSVNDLVEAANHVTFKIENTLDNSVIMQWSRQTNGNGGWRGIRSDPTGYDSDTSGGTRTYSFQHASNTADTRYVNYPTAFSDAASFLTWWEIAQ